MQAGLVPDDSSPAEEQWSRKNGLLAKASHSLAIQAVRASRGGIATKAGASHRCALAASDRAT